MTELFVTEKVCVSELVPHVKNPRKIKVAEKQKLWERLRKFGMIGIPVRDADGTLLSGNQRCEVLAQNGMGEHMIDVRTAIRKLTEEELREVMLIENSHAGEWDLKRLQDEFASFVDVNEFGIDLGDLMTELSDSEMGIEEKPEFPIVPKYSEKYAAVIIVIENSIDENFVRSILGLGIVKDYKTENVGESYVLNAKQFIEKWNNR